MVALIIIFIMIRSGHCVKHTTEEEDLQYIWLRKVDIFSV